MADATEVDVFTDVDRRIERMWQEGFADQRFADLRLDRDIRRGEPTVERKEVRFGGWAAETEQRKKLFSYLQVDDDDDEPAHAVADAWEPPHPLALPPELCDRLVAIAEDTPPGHRRNGACHMVELDPELEWEVVGRFRAANRAWWHLDLDRWSIHAKNYRRGDRHPVHQDLHPAAARRKLAGSVQLSDPDDYEGGTLFVYSGSDGIGMPTTRGTLIAFPGWTDHEVSRVTAGERWVLIVNGWGPPLR